MTVFEVFGPFTVPLAKGQRGGPVLDKAQVMKFWDDKEEFGSRKGCYLFGTNHSRGAMPWYVGKATKGFGQECFTADKIAKYLRAINSERRGRPIMYFVALPIARGRGNIRAINELEILLIQLAQTRNVGIVNIQGLDRRKWVVRGVTRSPRGKRSTAERGLIKLLGLRGSSEPSARPEEPGLPPQKPLTDAAATSEP